MTSGGTIDVATLVANKSLHGAWALGAFHDLRGLSSNGWQLKTAAMANRLNNLVVVLLEGKLELSFLHKFLPLLEILQNSEDGDTMTCEHNRRPFAEQGPATLVLVGEQLMDLLTHRVRSLLVSLGEEQALYSAPELAQDAVVLSSFGRLSNTEQLNVDLQGVLDEGVIYKQSGSLCELLDPIVVLAPIEEDILLLFHLHTNQA